MARRVKSKINDNDTDTGKTGTLTRGAAYVAAIRPICHQVPYAEVRVDSSGASSVSSPGSHLYDSKGKVIVGIRRLLRSRYSLVEEDIAAVLPELVQAAKAFFATWAEACYASGVNLEKSAHTGATYYKLTPQHQWHRRSGDAQRKTQYTPRDIIAQITRLMQKKKKKSKNDQVTSGEYMKKYGTPAYTQMLQHFGRFSKALAAAKERVEE